MSASLSVFFLGPNGKHKFNVRMQLVNARSLLPLVPVNKPTVHCSAEEEGQQRDHALQYLGFGLQYSL